MSDEELSTKEAYFQDQALLDILDDDQDYQNESYKNIEATLAEARDMPPPSLIKQKNSFLGPTPKERRANFEAYTKGRRTTARRDGQMLTRSSTAPKPDLVKPQSEVASKLIDDSRKLKRVSSLPQLAGKDQTPFYKRMGVVPRELKNGKNVKLAHKIKLEPEQKQLLKDKVVYFYPNDDVSMVRRTRIHKVIQLGAAWINIWSDDITHVIFDDASHTYSQLLKHLNRAGFPRKVVLVRFDPYVPQCIQFGILLDPDSPRFAVKGAPQKIQGSQGAESSQLSALSQTSLQIKPSTRRLAAQESRNTDSHSTAESCLLPRPEAELSAHVFEDTVEDSFIMPSLGDTEQAEMITVNQFDDALSLAIQEAKSVAHLPLDEDEDGEFSIANTFSDAAESEIDEEPPKLISKASKKSVSKASVLRDKSLDLNTFQCMDPGAGGFTSQNPNAHTIQILEEMGRYYDQMQDQWRTLAYRKGVTTLKKQTTKISTAKQAAALPFIGHRLAEKIEEIVLTDRLRKLESTRDDPLDIVLRLFLGVYGAGLVQTNKWIQAGHRTLEDLQGRAKLTESHKIGIEHYNDFNSRIPRDEVKAHGAVVRAALQKLDPKFEATVMGSYRRGAKDSGDIDMILTRPNTPLAVMRSIIFDDLVPHLYNTGFLKASLATSRSNDPTGTKWHGASCLPSSKVWRRMDFLLVPEEEMGAALIYFTGNDIFNRSIRLLARKKGMRLNQKGLYKDVKRGRRGEKLNEGMLVEGRSEKKIFEILGVPWREPHARIC